MFDSKDFKWCWINYVELYLPMHSSIYNDVANHLASLAS